MPFTQVPGRGAGPDFGSRLRSWRKRRGFSQIALGLDAQVSARHISFLETGRAQPSRAMVLKIATALDLPLRERNELLLSAGFAPRYEHHSLDDVDVVEARRALRFLLDAHEPYPAFVLDRYWQVVLWNRTQELLLREVAGADDAPSDLNVLDLVFVPGKGRAQFLNWEDVARAILRRLRRQLVRVGPGDPLQRKWLEIQDLPGVSELSLSEDLERPPPILVPMRIRNGDSTFTWFSTLAVFGAAGDIALDELVVESFFPGDDATRAFVEDLPR